MKIFRWLQTKLDRRQDQKQKPSWPSSASVQRRPLPLPPPPLPPPLPSDSRKEEFRDWPETVLLAIGTFGNKKVEEGDPWQKHAVDSSQPEPQDDISVEEVTELTKELMNSTSPSSLEVDPPNPAGNDNEAEVPADAKIVLNRAAKDLLADNKGGIRERSLSFLLRKMFVCHGGFAPTPSLKDPLTESRAEKILRTLLQRKIYPQSTLQPLAKKMLERQTASRRKFFGRRHEVILWSESESEETEREDGRNIKWVKTDSECK